MGELRTATTASSSCPVAIAIMDKEARRAAAHQLLQRCVDSGVNFSRASTEAQNLVECGAVLMANRVGDGFDEDAAFEQLKDKYGIRQQAEAKAAGSKANARKKESKTDEKEEEAAESGSEAEEKPKAKAASRKRKTTASSKQAEQVAESKDEEEGTEDDESSDDDEGRSGKKRRKKKTVASSPKKAQVKISEQATVPENKELSLAFHHLSRESFRVGDRMPGMAYAKVAKIIREFPERISAAAQLKGIKGVGKASLAKIDEFLEQGYINKLEELRRM